MNVARFLQDQTPVTPPPTTALGSLLAYICDPARKDFQPMNVNFGLLPPLDAAVPKKEKKQLMVERALRDLEKWMSEIGEKPVERVGFRTLGDGPVP